MSDRITEVSSLQQYKDDTTRFAIYISRARAIPDYRDGLKPIHRKILYCMYADNHAIDKKVKSAAVVGRVLELYHPHGDIAVYESMQPMTNWFEIYMPYIEGQGNFGSIQGDSAAAQRYTEARLTKFAIDCMLSELKDTDKVVDWTPTYDNSNLEPEYLPAAIPILLINGSFGVCIGIKVEIPRHNINEVIDATISLIDNPNASIELIPDHCMNCNIIDTNFKAISNKGSGSYKARGIIDIEDYKGRKALVIKSTPDLVFLNKVVEKIEELIQSNKILQIQDTADESTDKQSVPRNKQMRYVIILKKGADPNYVRDVIYKHTEMEKSYRVNFEVLNGLNPVRMSYKSYLLAFLEFRKLTKFRLYSNKLQDVQTKIHERELYVKVLKSGEIDNIINMIRKQKEVNDDYLVEYLISKLKVTDLQAKFLLRTDLRKLSMGYLNRYIEEIKELESVKNKCLSMIIDEKQIEDEIKQELLFYKSKYGKPRNCKVIKNIDNEVPRGLFKIVVTDNNFIKKMLINDNIGGYKGDNPKLVILAENTENILICDELGKVFKYPVSKIALTERNGSGTDIRLIIKKLTSNINKVLYEPMLNEKNSLISKHYVVVLTSNGLIKKMDIEDFTTAPPSGIYYTKLDDGDTVKDIIVVEDTSDIVIYSNSKALRISMNDVPYLKRNAKGNKTISSDIQVDGISVIDNTVSDIVVITEHGMINKFSSSGLEKSSRGRTGSKVIKLSKTDKIKALYGVNNSNSINIITKNNRNYINVKDIPSGSSVSSGVKMIATKTDVIVKCRLMEDEQYAK